MILRLSPDKGEKYFVAPTIGLSRFLPLQRQLQSFPSEGNEFDEADFCHDVSQARLPPNSPADKVYSEVERNSTGGEKNPARKYRGGF